MDDYAQDAYNSMLHEVQRKADIEFYRDNPVVAAFESLGDYVKAFEAELDGDHEIGARLVSFGSAVTIHVQQVGYSRPSLITFTGLTEKGDKVQLVQHISQLSFLLLAVRKIGDTPYRIGFIWDK
jgi:hypothetical protein